MQKQKNPSFCYLVKQNNDKSICVKQQLNSQRLIKIAEWKPACATRPAALHSHPVKAQLSSPQILRRQPQHSGK